MRLWILIGFYFCWIGCAKSDSPAQSVASARAAPSESKPLAGLAPGEGEDWPTFMGPRIDGTSLETGLMKSWPHCGYFSKSPFRRLTHNRRFRAGRLRPHRQTVRHRVAHLLS